MGRPPPGSAARVDINEARELMGPISQQTFWSRVDCGHEDECWPWRGGRTPKGYGISSIGSVSVLAHRLAYVLAGGHIYPGLVLRHRCDKPSCCNPFHLEVGTYADNEADKKRRIFMLTYCPHPEHTEKGTVPWFRTDKPDITVCHNHREQKPRWRLVDGQWRLLESAPNAQ